MAKKYMKYLLAANAQNNNGKSEMRSGMNQARGYSAGMEMGYGGMEMNDDMEMRRRYRRDSRGRFRSEMGDMDSDMEMGDRSNYGTEARNRDNGRLNMIGFNANREIETNYRMNATHHSGNEMEPRRGQQMSGGRASSNMRGPLTKQIAEDWVYNMQNEDGSRGPHWDMEKAQKLMERKKMKCDPVEFFAILNAMYSDFCKVMLKHGVESDDLYADLACAWLEDKDAMPNKAMLYYENIVK